MILAYTKEQRDKFETWALNEHNQDGSHKQPVTAKTSIVDADTMGLFDSAASFVGKYITFAILKLAIYAGIKPVEGTVWNGKIKVTDTGSGIKLELVTLAGTDATASDVIYATIGGVVRTITAALSVTVADGANTFNAGSAELATKEIDCFAYLGYNATDGVTLGFGRIPGASQYSDFSVTATDEKYLAVSNRTTAAATDYYNVIGRFAATLSAGAGYTWSVPTFTATNLIQKPIYETRWLAMTSVWGGFSSSPTGTFSYKLNKDVCSMMYSDAAQGTSNAASLTFTGPIKALQSITMAAIIFAKDNGTNLAQPSHLTTAGSSATITAHKVFGVGGGWAAANGKDAYVGLFGYKF